MGGRTVIVRTDCEQVVPHVDSTLRSVADLILLPEFGTTEAQLIEACREATLIVHCYTPITRKVIESAKKLRGIVKYGVGIDAIDIQAAKDHGIPIANIPEYGERTVAEGAFNLMMNLMKNTRHIQKKMTSEGWAWPTEETLGTDLYGKTACLLGYGKIARSMAKMCRGFGMNLVSYDPFVAAADMAAEGVEKAASLEDLVTRADVLSIHTVLNPDTRGIISKKLIAMMKPTAIVVNVSRGPIVDEAALKEAYVAKRIGGIGFDVFGKEPIMRGKGHIFESIMDDEQVILTPHLAFWTKEARDRLQNEVIERCEEILAGKPMTVLSSDPRLVTQKKNVKFGGLSVASGRYVPAPAKL